MVYQLNAGLMYFCVNGFFVFRHRFPQWVFIIMGEHKQATCYMWYRTKQHYRRHHRRNSIKIPFYHGYAPNWNASRNDATQIILIHFYKWVYPDSMACTLQLITHTWLFIRQIDTLEWIKSKIILLLFWFIGPE